MQIRTWLFVLLAFSFADTAISASPWVYSNGAFSWSGDYSYSAYANYWDNSGAPLDGAYDIQVSISSAFGGWQPYASNMAFNATGYSNFTIALKPTQDNQKWQIYFTKAGNVPAGKTLNLANYGAAPKVGVWATYTIPLSDLGVSGATIGSFAIQDTTGLNNNSWYVDDVGFSTSAASGPTVYNDGAFNWPGSYSYGVSLNYNDTAGNPASGTSDLAVSLTGQWGAWQPYSPNMAFDSSNYNAFTFALKPTRANQTWQVYFTKAGNVSTGQSLDLANYGAAPKAGVWATYTIPLSDFGMSDGSIGSFAIQDTTGSNSNTWYVDSVGFNTSGAASTATAAVGAVSNPSIYYNGVFNWPGDFSYGVALNYHDTSGAPTSGSYDLAVSLTEHWGGWQPYAKNFSYNSTGFTKLTFSLKPTVANQLWQFYFMKVGDIPTGKVVNLADYGPAPVAGQWATYTVPLADVGVLGTNIYKFAIQDETGLWSNTWYVDNVAFE